MNHLSILVLALTFGTASIQAEELPVRMTFSGSGTRLALGAQVRIPLSLQPRQGQEYSVFRMEVS